jgi:hypothetical protein
MYKWWLSLCRTDKVLVSITVCLLVFAILVGRPLILTGQGDSMEGPDGLRDGAREFCVPLRRWPIIPGRIYAFRDQQGEVCLKRAKTVDPDGKVYFLGDNQKVDRNGQPESIDSRSFGKISRDRIIAVRLFTLPRCFDGLTSQREAQKRQKNFPADQFTLAREKAKQERAAYKKQLRLAGEGPLVVSGKLADYDDSTGEIIVSPMTIKLPRESRWLELNLQVTAGSTKPPEAIVEGLAEGKWLKIGHILAGTLHREVAVTAVRVVPPKGFSVMVTEFHFG